MNNEGNVLRSLQLDVNDINGVILLVRAADVYIAPERWGRYDDVSPVATNFGKRPGTFQLVGGAVWGD